MAMIRSWQRPLGIFLVPLALAGCASSSTVGSGPPPQSGATSLTITVDGGPGSTPRAMTLACKPASGTHPDPEAACAALERLADPFAGTPPGQACTDLYGGPQRATVSGTYLGRAIQASFNRVDGCNIARWDSLAALLGSRGGA